MEAEKLKTSPKAYSQDHKHIELLRYKSFAVMHSLTQEEIKDDDFQYTNIQNKLSDNVTTTINTLETSKVNKKTI